MSEKGKIIGKRLIGEKHERAEGRFLTLAIVASLSLSLSSSYAEGKCRRDEKLISTLCRIISVRIIIF
jgi:hypothetical protein